MNCNNAFFKEVTNSSFPKSDKCMPSFRNRVPCVLKISGYFMEAPHTFLTTNVARAEFNLVLQFSPSLFERHNDQFLRGKICDHTIIVFGNSLVILDTVNFMYFCKPFSVLRGLPISLPPQCITKSVGCLLHCLNISLIVWYNRDQTMPLIPCQIILCDVSPKLSSIFCCAYFWAQ